jgi:hypothetical protein
MHGRRSDSHTDLARFGGVLTHVLLPTLPIGVAIGGRPSEVSTMPRCLFTDIELKPDNREEHAPPKKLGGRFASSHSTSSEFNNRASWVEAPLVASWRPLLTHLAPAMSAEARPEGGMRVRVPGNPVPHEIVAGRLGVAGARVLERTSDGRPHVIAGGDRAKLERLAQTAGIRGEPKLYTPDPEDDVLEPEMLRVDGIEYEMASLKAILTAFDVVYHSEPSSWVRSEQTEVARALVRSVIERHDQIVGYSEIVWGRDPRLVPRLQDLGRRLPRHGVLDHVMVACGDPVRRVLDVAWLIFGHEAIGFRLWRDYRGEPFCHVIGCSPVREGEPLGPVSVAGEFILPSDPGLRSITVGEERPREDLLDANQRLWSEAAAHAAAIGEQAQTDQELSEALYSWAHREWMNRDNPIRTAGDVVATYASQGYRSKRHVVLSKSIEALRAEFQGLFDVTVEFSGHAPADPVATWAVEAVPGLRLALRVSYNEFGPHPVIRHLYAGVEPLSPEELRRLDAEARRSGR